MISQTVYIAKIIEKVPAFEGDKMVSHSQRVDFFFTKIICSELGIKLKMRLWHFVQIQQ